MQDRLKACAKMGSKEGKEITLEAQQDQQLLGPNPNSLRPLKTLQEP